MVNKTLLASLNFKQYLVDRGWYASYQCCGKVLSTWIKVLCSSERKINLLCI